MENNDGDKAKEAFERGRNQVIEERKQSQLLEEVGKIMSTKQIFEELDIEHIN